MSAVDTVGIDETSIARGHSYISLFVDLQQRRMIHVSEGKGSDSLSDFVEHFEKQNAEADRVKEVSCDMSAAFIKSENHFIESNLNTFLKIILHQSIKNYIIGFFHLSVVP